MYKQSVLILRSFITKEKRAKLICTASIKLIERLSTNNPKRVAEWFRTGQKKIILQTETSKDLLRIRNILLNQKIPFLEIFDLESEKNKNSNGSNILGLVIGPEKEKILDRIIGHLKLL
ncbi:MAG: peptidyl-tRNA hydrolase [Promethearchaeota archaeon]